MTDRQHIATALRSLHRADLTLGAYAEHGHSDDLDAAYDAARRVSRALRAERRRMLTILATITPRDAGKRGSGGKASRNVR